MRKSIWAIGIVAVLVVALATFTGQGQAADKKAQSVDSSLMRQKLDHAQKLLEAISLGDYDRMITHSHELQRISLEARWSQPHSPSYAQYGDEFRSALDHLVASAQKQSIDGAALNYVQVILTCVQCHKVVREGEKTASAADAGIEALLRGAHSGGQ